IAFVGVVCFTPAAYALSQQMSTNSLMPLLVAHEIGHTFGSDHDTTGTSPRYIMYPNLGVSNLEQFSPSSREQITSYIAKESCVTQSLQPPTNPPNSPPEEVSDTSWTITGDSQIKIGKMRVPGSWSGSLDFNADGTFVYSIPSLSNPLTTVQFTGMWTQQKKKVLLFPSGQSFFDYASEVQAYVQATTGLTETSSLLDWQIKVKVNTKAGTLKLKMKQKGFVTFDKYKAKMKGLAFPN
ncbi:MAG: M12 family metallo-peptidase, partial [Planctomycetes bacterium]|nr:M12 family metallo-peptidase [Planctomycetota bacterium]